MNPETYEILTPVKNEGVFRGVGRGFAGEIEVEVTFEKDGAASSSVKITDIRVIRSDDVKRQWDRVVGKLKPRVIEKQSTGLDAVTGATASSNGFLNAIRDAEKKAYKRR